MKQALLFTGIFFALYFPVLAQEEIPAEPLLYKKAIGIRLGPNSPAISSGFTAKYFLNEKHAIEGIVGVTNGVGVCGLFEWHHPIASVENLQWFVGAGGFLGYRDSKTLLGVAGIGGLDYKFPDIPLNISIDWKPELNLINDVGYDGAGVGLSARFTF
jgi:hypothetical protein